MTSHAIALIGKMDTYPNSQAARWAEMQTHLAELHETSAATTQ